MRGRLTAAIALAALLTATAATSARAQDSPYPPGPFAPWDGTNPFQCELQDVGFGVDFPDPGADPFCVKFDKTRQNITELGIVDFLLNEPARVAAALSKCFYYQRDHWTASVVQDSGPELWNWVGSYFIDRARAVGGVNLEDFRILGQPASPAAYLPLPPEIAPYFDQNGGGTYLIVDIPLDPGCYSRVDTPEEAARLYSAFAPPTSAGATPADVLPGTSPASAKRSRRCAKRKRNGGLEAGAAATRGKGKRCGKRKRR